MAQNGSNHAANALRLLSESHTESQTLFQSGNDDGATTGTDSDTGSETSIVDDFMGRGGQEEILQICGFTLSELRDVLSMA